MEDAKATFKILLFVSLLLVAIIVPLLVFQDLNFDDEDFPEYQNIKITEGKLDDEYEYDNIRQQLESDYYFNKVATMTEYNSERYTSSNLDKLIWHFIFNLETQKIEQFSKIDKEKQIYCFTKNNFLKAFEELYNVNIENDTYLLKGYYQYVYEKYGGYCFDVRNVAKDYDNDVKISVERVALIGTTVTTDLYVYEYYVADSSSQNSNIKDLENAIASKNHSGAENIVKNKLYGNVTHKQLKFKINKRGKYFKYTILSSNNLDY